MAVMYIGQNNQAKKVKKFYLGINNQSKKVKRAYIGVNGQAKLFYKGTVLPNTYQQIEYLGLTTATYQSGIKIPSPLLTENPRFVAKFSLHKETHNSGAGYVIFGGTYGYTAEENIYYELATTDLYATAYNDDYFVFWYGKANSSGEAVFEKTTVYSGEKIQLDKKYTVDFNNISNNTSRFYLYCESGYFSDPSHNSIGSITKSTMTSSSSAYIGLLNYCTNGGNFGNQGGGVRLYSCKIYNSSNTLLKDLYPCKRISDNMYGVYDIVNNAFFSTNNNNAANLDVGPNYEGTLD